MARMIGIHRDLQNGAGRAGSRKATGVSGVISLRCVYQSASMHFALRASSMIKIVPDTFVFRQVKKCDSALWPKPSLLILLFLYKSFVLTWG